MVFKEATDCCTGTAAIYGAPDIVKIAEFLNGKAITGCEPVVPRDTIFTISDATDITALIRFDATSITTGTTRVVTVPDANLIMVGTTTCQTLSSKTLTTPTIAATGFTNMTHTHLAANTGGQITEASISDLQCYLLNFDPTGSPLLDARFWIGDAANLAVELTISGGVTVANTGVATVVTNANLTGCVTSVGNATTTVTNANLTGPVTSCGNATTIVAEAVTIPMLADGTDGELITWDACTKATTVPVGTIGHVLTSGGAGAEPTFQGNQESFIIAVGDETTALTTGLAKVTFRTPYAFTVTGIRASVTTAATGAVLLTVDVHESGTTIMACDKLVFDASELTTTTAATPPVVTDTALADDAQMTIDIDLVGCTIAGAGLKVTIIGNRT